MTQDFYGTPITVQQSCWVTGEMVNVRKRRYRCGNTRAISNVSYAFLCYWCREMHIVVTAAEEEWYQ